MCIARWSRLLIVVASLTSPGVAASFADTTAPTAPAQTGANPLTLDDAIRIALEAQPQLAIAASQRAAAGARLTDSLSSYYPQLTPLVQHTSQRSSYHLGGAWSTQSTDRTEASIGLRQLVYDTGKREAGASAARRNLEASDYSLRHTRQTVILNVTTAYYEALRQKELLRVQEAAVERARTTYEATKAYAEQGTVRRIDTLQAEADYTNAQVQLGIARNNVRLALVSLRNAIGAPAMQAVSVSDKAPEWPSTDADKASVQSYIDKAMESRLDLKRDTAYLAADRSSLQVARINAGLQLESDITAGYRFDPDRGDSRMLVATLSFPLFDAGSARARVKTASATVDQTLSQLELSRQDIRLSVEQAFLTREEARERIVSARAAVAAAQANYDAASESYREGVDTVVDVITARTQLVTAETSLVQTLYDFHTADARLRRAIGDNDPYWSGGSKR